MLHDGIPANSVRTGDEGDLEFGSGHLFWWKVDSK